MKLYDYLQKHSNGSMDILVHAAIKKANVPYNLSCDVRQEILLAWYRYDVNVKKFSHKQILSYASKTAYSCAQKILRELGTPVYIPREIAKSCDVNPYNYCSEPLYDHSMISDFKLDECLFPTTHTEDAQSDTEAEAVAADHEANYSVIKLLKLGESIEAIAEYKRRSVRWVKEQVKSELKNKSHATA